MEKVYWYTKDNDMIEINDLTDKHLYNILSMIQRKNRYHDMRIRTHRELNLEQLKSIITENKYIVEPRYKEHAEYMKYLFDKHHYDQWEMDPFDEYIDGYGY